MNEELETSGPGQLDLGVAEVVRLQSHRTLTSPATPKLRRNKPLAPNFSDAPFQFRKLRNRENVMRSESIGHQKLRWTATEHLGLAVMIAGLFSFAVLAELITVPGTQQLDESVLWMFRDTEDPSRPVGPLWFHELARDFTALGGYGLLSTVLVLVTVFLHLERRHSRAHFVVVTVIAGYAISVFLKHAFDRPRPEIVPHLSHVSSSSFPSGHSMMSAVVYLTLGLMLAEIASCRRVKCFLVITPLTIAAAVGVSRVLMGVHYPTDVAAGWSVVLSWTLFCWLLLRRYRARRCRTDGSFFK